MKNIFPETKAPPHQIICPCSVFDKADKYFSIPLSLEEHQQKSELNFEKCWYNTFSSYKYPQSNMEQNTSSIFWQN